MIEYVCVCCAAGGINNIKKHAVFVVCVGGTEFLK
jgi:hypothetical protein